MLDPLHVLFPAPMLDATGTMGAVAGTRLDVQELCRQLQPLRGLSQLLCGLLKSLCGLLQPLWGLAQELRMMSQPMCGL